jgi:hypothetical protein
MGKTRTWWKASRRKESAGKISKRKDHVKRDETGKVSSIDTCKIKKISKKCKLEKHRQSTFMEITPSSYHWTELV